MKIMEIGSAKGGTGVTTVACALAVIAGQQGSQVLLVDLADNPDTTKWLGTHQSLQLATPSAGSFLSVIENDNVTIWRPWASARKRLSANLPEGEWDVVIIDAGTTGQHNYTLNNQIVVPERVLCVTNEYMCLSNVINSVRPNKIICFFDENRSLTFGDIQSVLFCPDLVKMPLDYALSRAIDAGLATNRKHLYEGWAKELLSLVAVHK